MKKLLAFSLFVVLGFISVQAEEQLSATQNNLDNNSQIQERSKFKINFFTKKNLKQMEDESNNYNNDNKIHLNESVLEKEMILDYTTKQMNSI